MPDRDTRLRLYGTEEPPQTARSIRCGALSLLYSPEAVRRISWNGTELVRAITWPIRDENWGTYPPEILSETVEDNDTGFWVRLDFSVGAGRLVCSLHIEGSEAEGVAATLTMTPQGGPFATNRAGFTVLHPIRGTAGAPVRVTHSDGTEEECTFPRLISPEQPVMDITGLRYGVGGAETNIAFGGEIFEMEDQRNWSDASYKTYCVPLVYPFVYEIEESVTQSIHMSFSGSGTGGAQMENRALAARTTSQAAPRIGLAVEHGWAGGVPARTLVAGTGASHLLARVGPGAGGGYLADVADLAGQLGADVDAEIVLPNDGQTDARLRETADLLAMGGLSPGRVIALTGDYLASHQPSGPWPDGPTPPELCRAARAAFPAAAIGGGMMTNFTEMNRCRPDPALCDYITHGNTALVHAGDDMSVLETLEALPQVFESAEAMSGGKPYRLGLVSIGMRSNPYGAAVAENRAQVRRTMAREDPRQRGLFAAAWAVGVLAATEGRAVESICLAAPVGPFGIVHEPQDYPQAGYDDGHGIVYPLYHVVREARAMAGADRLAFEGLADGIAACGVAQGATRRAMIANLTDTPQSLALDRVASAALLDDGSFVAAVQDADWLDKAGRQAVQHLDLAPFAVGFITWSA